MAGYKFWEVAVEMTIGGRLMALAVVAAFVLLLLQSSDAQPSPFQLTPHYAGISRIVERQPPGTTFLLACGTYRIQAAIRPLAGDSFVGAGTIKGVPNAPPCAIINGAVVVSNWTRITEGGHNLWYSTVGPSRILNIPNGLQVNCMTPSGGASDNGYIMWTPSTPKSAGDRIVDANGNTETAQNSGTTRPANGPNWSNVRDGFTTDNDIRWRLTSLASAEGCSYPQDLFYTPADDKDIRHSVVKTHALAWNSGNIGAGNWYIDFENVGGHGSFTVYVADDPGTYTVELTLVRQALVVRAANVRIQNLSFEKFATPNLHGTIEPEGINDLVGNNWITHSHGEGIELHLPSALGVIIDSNEVVEMGESGINTGGGQNTKVTNNRIERNNEDGTAYGYEAGGTKFANDSSTLVRGNTVSCNNGNGLWGDAGEIGSTYSDNSVSHNLYNGITYEISHSGSIIRNILIDNAQANACQCVAPHVPILNGHDVCTGAQTCSGIGCSVCTDGKSEIYVHTSDTTTVGGNARYGNTITSNCAGIQMNQDGRLPVRGNVVSYNTLTLHTGSAVINTPLGGENDSGESRFNLYTALPANYFDHNSYRFDTWTASRICRQWQWQTRGGPGNQGCNWSCWQAEGQDIRGAVSP